MSKLKEELTDNSTCEKRVNCPLQSFIEGEIKKLRKIAENLTVTRWGQAGPDCMVVPE